MTVLLVLYVLAATGIVAALVRREERNEFYRLLYRPLPPAVVVLYSEMAERL